MLCFVPWQNDVLTTSLLYDDTSTWEWQTVYAGFANVFNAITNEILSTETSEFHKQIIILNSFNTMWTIFAALVDEANR